MPQIVPSRDGRIIIHFDYDCFYASVFEREDPKLRHLPLAVQQKQIIVTCNYEARRRGLHKLQLIREARKQCPDVVIVLGEDLTRFRNASKELYSFLRSFSWSGKVERLGFDEVFMDVTDLIDYNFALLNRYDLTACFFHLDRNDPTVGFEFDASRPFGNTYPAATECPISPPHLGGASPEHHQSAFLYLRLILGSFLARHLRHQLEEQKGYTATAGISVNKLLSKLVGNLNKPHDQTTLLSSSSCHDEEQETTVMRFMDSHEIGKIPGIGFKMAQKIREYMLGRPATHNGEIMYGSVRDRVPVRDVRLNPEMSPALLEKLIGGPGVHRNMGDKIWELLHGVDDSEVSKAKDVPRQISIENSYRKLDEMKEVEKELLVLAGSLLRRMRIDLTSSTEKTENDSRSTHDFARSHQWVARPRTLRLTTRPRPPLNPDGSPSRSSTRISKSCDMPSIAFSDSNSIEAIAERVVHDSLVPLFHKLHPDASDWDLSLINVCATNMSQLASDDRDGAGRDISSMFRRQVEVLKEWNVKDDICDDLKVSRNEDLVLDTATAMTDANFSEEVSHNKHKDEEKVAQQIHSDEDASDSEEAVGMGEVCGICGAYMPVFAIVAHERFHNMAD